MHWASWFRSLPGLSAQKQNRRRQHVRLALEQLEDRVVPYSVSGDAWPHPNLITISFMPDGTPLSSAVGSTITSNLFSAFNAKFGSTAAWENQILKAAQAWAQQTNINFEVVPDSGASSGSGNYQQGNPSFGDIRVGGYVFGNSTLATTYMPPPVNNYSLAGDITFNTGEGFHVGSTYDLFSVAAHEFGHALGLDHTSAGTGPVMYPSYTGMKSALSADDVAGIRNIYSDNNARTSDGVGNTATTATNLNPLISSSLTALDANLNLASTSQTDWFSSTAPARAGSTMTVQVQSQGLSLLSPKVTVYAANGSTVLGSASGLNQYGTTLDVTVTGVSAGQQYLVKVQGADTTPFSTGAYALALNFGKGATPVAASPNTQVANGSPPSGGGGAAEGSGTGDSLLDSIPTILGLVTGTGTGNNSLIGAAPSDYTVRVYLVSGSGNRTFIGSTVAQNNSWSLPLSAALGNGSYTFVANTVDPLGNLSALSAPLTVVIDLVSVVGSVLHGLLPATRAGATAGVTVSVNSQPPTTAAGSLVTFIDGNTILGPVGADTHDHQTFTGPTLAKGKHNVSVFTTDAQGNGGLPSDPLVFQI
jgi:hypothetical protein